MMKINNKAVNNVVKMRQVEKEIQDFIRYLNFNGDWLNQYQYKIIQDEFPIVLDMSAPDDIKKEAVNTIFWNLEDQNRQCLCSWAWHAVRNNLICKATWSEILIKTHTRGKVHSLLSIFPLSHRIEMFKSADPKHLMSETEYQRFLSLPDEVKIYRGGFGVSANKLKFGMSWTTDVDLAAWFANRFTHKGPPVVIEAMVKKENIFGCFDYENEIIIKGGRVSKMKACEIDYEKSNRRIVLRAKKNKQHNQEQEKNAA
jgi:hypothetical protein